MLHSVTATLLGGSVVFTLGWWTSNDFVSQTVNRAIWLVTRVTAMRVKVKIKAMILSIVIIKF